MNRRDAGRLGGIATYRKHGTQHMRDIGKRGAAVFWKRYHLVPIEINLFAIVNRETGQVVATTGGK